MPISRDLAIFVPMTGIQAITLPLAHAYGVIITRVLPESNAHASLFYACTQRIMHVYMYAPMFEGYAGQVQESIGRPIDRLRHHIRSVGGRKRIGHPNHIKNISEVHVV